MKRGSVFDQILNELAIEDNGTEQLDQCMQFNYKLARKVPLRYKIIAIAFVRKYTLEELNEKLQDYGMSKLYARNLWEASLLYAFRNGLNYEEWRQLSEYIRNIKDSKKPQDGILDQKNITVKKLKEYLDNNSIVDHTELVTKHVTRHIEKSLSSIKCQEEFLEYINSNIRSFSTVREKTRYYFCKYLYYYLDQKIEEFIKISSKGVRSMPEDILEGLYLFKGGIKLKRNTLSDLQVRNYLEDTQISCGVLYSEFNEFFFGYVSLDWMHILLEQAGNLQKLPQNKVYKLANAARYYDKKYKDLDDLAVIEELDKWIEQQEQALDDELSLDSADRGYQKNRVGENTIRKYLKGTLDLDRTTFICFLLFFSSDLSTPRRMILDEERLNTILEESSFRILDEDNDFDFFVINYLRAEDPVDYLMEEVTRYALSQENFYLYKVYQASRSEDADFSKLLSYKVGS